MYKVKPIHLFAYFSPTKSLKSCSHSTQNIIEVLTSAVVAVLVQCNPWKCARTFHNCSKICFQLGVCNPLTNVQCYKYIHITIQKEKMERFSRVSDSFIMSMRYTEKIYSTYRPQLKQRRGGRRSVYSPRGSPRGREVLSTRGLGHSREM